MVHAVIMKLSYGGNLDGLHRRAHMDRPSNPRKGPAGECERVATSAAFAAFATVAFATVGNGSGVNWVWDSGGDLASTTPIASAPQQ